jgi:3-oxoadipate CoA-transferase, beta subunit
MSAAAAMPAVAATVAAGFAPLNRRQMAWRAAQDLREGMYVNLGIGLPTMVGDFIPSDREIVLHSENGILGMGPAPAPDEADPDLINAGKQPITLVTGASLVHHGDSFVIVRGGHLDLCLLGGYQVSMTGDLANWATPGEKKSPSVGGAMDLAVGAKEIRVLMEHNTKEGEARIVERCTYPLTAAGVVKRIYTNLAVLDVVDGGLVVREIVDGLPEDELRKRTAAPLTIATDCIALTAPTV